MKNECEAISRTCKVEHLIYIHTLSFIKVVLKKSFQDHSVHCLLNCNSLEHMDTFPDQSREKKKDSDGSTRVILYKSCLK